MIMKLHHILPLILSGLTGIPMALAVPGDGTQGQFDISDGLSNGYVISIAEDSQNRIWVATESGLNRFDGKKFITYTKDNSGLPGNELNTLALDPEDKNLLWVSTQRNGFCLLDIREDKLTKVDTGEWLPVAVTSITPSSKGGVWLNDYHLGSYRFDRKSGKLEKYNFETVNGLPRRSWITVEAPDGRLYVGHVNDGLSIVDTTNLSFSNYTMANSNLPGNCIYEIEVAENGFVWLGTEDGVALFNPFKQEMKAYRHEDSDPTSMAPGAIRSITLLHDGSVAFASTQGGTVILPGGTFTYDQPDKIKFTRLADEGNPGLAECLNVRDVYEDSFGNLWIGHYRSGVSVVSHVAPLFKKLDTPSSNSRGGRNLVAWSCDVSQDGSLIVGGDGEIAIYKEGKWTSHRMPGTREDMKSPVTAVMAFDANKIIVGTIDRGAWFFEPSSKKFTKIEGVPDNVRFISRDPMEGVLLGSDKNLWRLDGVSAQLLNINGKLSDEVIQTVARDNEGNLWIGTFGKGIEILSPDLTVSHHLSDEEGFPSNAVNDLYKDSKGRMWAATRAGLVVFDKPSDPDSYKLAIDPKETGIYHVRAVTEDRDGKIWATAENGVMSLDPINFNMVLHGDNINSSLNSFMDRGICNGREGKIFLASANGVFLLDPSEGKEKMEEFPVRLSGLTIFKEGPDRKENEIIMPAGDSKIVLPHNQSNFKITYNIPDQGVMMNSRFVYNIQGLDDVWLENKDDNSVVFRNLSPGVYKFRVRYQFKGGEWTEPYTVATIKISSPWWWSWWMITIYCVIGLGMLGALGFMYVRRVRLKERLIAEMKQSRNQQKLNEERLRFFTNITHELRTPLTLIMGPIEDMVSDPSLPQKYTNKLRMIRESSNSLLSLINGILEFRKTETQNRDITVAKGNISNIVYEIALRYKELNTNPKVEFILDIDRDVKEMWFDREMVSIMLNNILSNAVKYTDKGSITVSLHQVERDGANRTEISVADTGHGMKKDKVDLIFQRYYQINGEHQASGTGIGLALFKNLADLHQAEVTVESEEGRGSKFTLSFLTDNIYPNATHAENQKTEKLGVLAPVPEDVLESSVRGKVLVVEDNKDIRDYIRQSLESDYDVVTAGDGLEGLKAVHDESPTIVVSDIMMPEMDGATMCKHIKEDILTSHIPVILLTAKDSIEDREAGYESGADSYLTKPFSAKLLRSRIANLLSQRRRLARILVKEAVEVIAVGESNEATKSAVESVEEAPIEIKLSPIDRKFIDKINEYILQNIADPDLDVTKIAEKMCMSYSTLYRKSKSILGISMLDYIKSIRLAKAKELIEKGEMKISEIAYATGYNTPSAFGKVFRKEFGMSPTEYAESLK